MGTHMSSEDGSISAISLPPQQPCAIVVQEDVGEAALCMTTLRELGLEPELIPGTAALERLKAQQPDILVIDLVPSAMEALAFAQSMTSKPVAVVVAAPGQDPRVETVRAAGGLVIAKPLDAVEVANTVAFGLHRRASAKRDLNTDELAALHAIGTIAASNLDPPAALIQILGQILVATGGDEGALLLPNNKDPDASFTLAATIGQTYSRAPGSEHQGVAKWVAAHRRPLWLVGPLNRYPQFQNLAPNLAVGASLVAPITWVGQVLGVITVNSARPNALKAEHLAFVVSAAELAGIYLHHLHAEEGREHRQRLTMLGQMAASCAHELANPVAFVRSNLEFAVGQLAKAEQSQDWDSIRELLEVLRESLDGVARIANLAADMKSMGRKNAGKRGPVSLKKLLQRCEVLVLARFKHKLALTLDLGPDLTVNAEPEPLMQVFLNLLLNAAEVVPAKEGRISVRCRRQGSFAIAEVEDNGPGIPLPISRRLFEPFFTTRSEGTGLGLAISREIVRKYDGDVTFTTEPGKGSCFVVSLPLVPAELKPQPTILVVDDDLSLTKALVRLLSRGGYKTLASSSTKDALAMASSRQIDVVLTDFRMPGGTGADLVRELRAQGCRTPAILLTANFDASEVQQAIAEGLFVATIAKPWNHDDLLAKVSEVCARS